MDYQEIQALESYKKRAQATLAARRQQDAEEDRLAEERHEQARVEQWVALKASLAEIIPPALLPLVRLPDDAEAPRSHFTVPFFCDDVEILRLQTTVSTNMSARFSELHVPEMAIIDSAEGWYAAPFFNRRRTHAEKNAQGGVYDAPRWWEIATAHAFEQLDIYRGFEIEAATHNAALAERRKEDESVAPVFSSGAATTPSPFVMLEVESCAEFAWSVNEYLADGYMLHGSPSVVVRAHHEFDGVHVPYFYQALVRPEVP